MKKNETDLKIQIIEHFAVDFCFQFIKNKRASGVWNRQLLSGLYLRKFGQTVLFIISLF